MFFGVIVCLAEDGVHAKLHLGVKAGFGHVTYRTLAVGGSWQVCQTSTLLKCSIFWLPPLPILGWNKNLPCNMKLIFFLKTLISLGFWVLYLQCPEGLCCCDMARVREMWITCSTLAAWLFSSRRTWWRKTSGGWWLVRYGEPSRRRNIKTS